MNIDNKSESASNSQQPPKWRVNPEWDKYSDLDDPFMHMGNAYTPINVGPEPKLEN